MPKHIRKVPSILQMEAVECGAASLTMILGYYKKYVTLEEVREKCGVNRDGSKASNILKAARSYGLSAQGCRVDIDKLMELELPVIIHWNMNHFLILEGYHKGIYYLNDPAAGRRTVDSEEFGKAFTGIALTFGKTPELIPSGNKQPALKAFQKQFTRYKKEIAYISITAFLTVVPTLVTAWLIKFFLDEIWINGRTQWLSGLLFGLFLLAVLKALAYYIFNVLNYRLLEKVRLSETSRFIWKTINLPINFFMQRYVGDINARFKNVDNVASFMAFDLVNAFSALLAMILYVVVLFQYNLFLTLFILASVIINIVVLSVNNKAMEGINNRISMTYMKLIGATISGIELIETIKTTSAEPVFFEKWAGNQSKLINEKQEANSKIQGMMNLPSLISMISAAIVLFWGGYLIIHGDLTVGTLVAFQSIMASFFVSGNILNQVGMKLPKLIADVARLEDVYNYPDRTSEEVVTQGENLLQGNLKVENITFGFSQLEEAFVQDFSMELKPGQRIALVGGSGSGKSTIAKLIAGIYQPWSGEVSIDHKPVKELSKAMLHKSIAMVNQEIVLFEGTISDNISLWQLDIEEALLIKAAKNACIHDDIVSRPGGYQYHMKEEGQDFSGGQRQRIEIARAFLQEPCIMILDEATSALDPATEQEIDYNLRRLGYTCIIVAHRLSTIRDCDEIIVLDKGKIVQRGTHESLLEQNGLYADLIKTM